MKKSFCLFIVVLLAGIFASAQNPSPALVGYWHNWNDANAPYIQLNQVDARYTFVDIAFAVPHWGTDYQMEFIPDQVSPATLISQIQTLQGQGKKVIISMGGASSPVSLDNTTERDSFISTMTSIINTYGFDGIDIDFEGSSLIVTGGTINTPVDAPVINLIYAVKQIMSSYYASHGKRLLLTMAPETAFVQGGMSAYGSIWGAYLPVIQALRDSIEILHVQLYNSGSMYGINGNIYYQGTADFIVAMTEAVIQGFNTAGGLFLGLPASKVAVGLPACSSAAGGGFTDTATVKLAIDYLRGNGPKPGSYTLVHTGGYPALRGMMTWSVNWDAVSTCASVYQYAANYEKIFGSSSGSPKTLNLSSVFLEGLYNGNGTMFQARDASGPYWTDGSADHISIELHNSSTYSVIEFVATDVPLRTLGRATVSVPSGKNGSYYVTIKHRNSIETTTALPVNFSGSAISCSFDAMTRAYGNNMTFLLEADGTTHSPPLIFGGDINQDRQVEAEDMNQVGNAAADFELGYLQTDVYCDGQIEASDINICGNNAATFVYSHLPN